MTEKMCMGQDIVFLSIVSSYTLCQQQGARLLPSSIICFLRGAQYHSASNLQADSLISEICLSLCFRLSIHFTLSEHLLPPQTLTLYSYSDISPFFVFSSFQTHKNIPKRLLVPCLESTHIQKLNEQLGEILQSFQVFGRQLIT